MKAILTVAMGLLMVLNMLGGIVAGIWLAIIGKWGSLGLGFGLMIFGSFAIGIALLPGLIVAVPAAALAEKGRVASAFALGSLNIIYTYIVLAAWCILIMIIFGKRADGNSLIPFLLWAYAVATGPLSYMASKEQENEFTAVTCFALQIAFVISMIVILIINPTMLSIFIVFGVVMGISLTLQLILTFSMMRGEAERQRFNKTMQCMDTVD